VTSHRQPIRRELSNIGTKLRCVVGDVTKPGGHYLLVNDLDSTTAGYGEIAGNTAHQGEGWQPAATPDD
jgi:hypothetical protein